MNPKILRHLYMMKILRLIQVSLPIISFFQIQYHTHTYTKRTNRSCTMGIESGGQNPEKSLDGTGKGTEGG